ncbi:MAG: hypothetical protein WD341_09790 [Tistlia sp.]|uniref:hypothetical protein n=1 Tax=Tistlia sp. TaxID=3057121 RepID=UPI0034A15965
MNATTDHRILEALFQAVENPDAAPFELQRLDVEGALEAAPRLASLIQLWDERRGEAAVPDWADMDFADFRGWHAALVVSDLPAGEPDPIYRVIGEDFRIVSYTTEPGQKFSDRTPLLYDRQFREHFREIRDRGLIGRATGPAAFVGREHLRLEVLELPFRNGGERVARLVHLMSYDLAAPE